MRSMTWCFLDKLKRQVKYKTDGLFFKREWDMNANQSTTGGKYE
jgi:hypothetical protein